MKLTQEQILQLARQAIHDFAVNMARDVDDGWAIENAKQLQRAGYSLLNLARQQRDSK